MHPREIAHFSNPRFGAVRIAAGGQCSLAVNEVGSLMFWGQFKVQLHIVPVVLVVYQFYMSDMSLLSARFISIDILDQLTAQPSGEATMYPKPEHELSGWKLDRLDAGCV